MSPELDDKLCQDFPLLFNQRHGSPSNTLMCFGFECGNGWFALIYDLSSKLEPLLQALKDSLSPYKLKKLKTYYGHFPGACQVKEKYAGLRFYMDGSTEEMDALIRVAEEKSFTICEQCGKPGTVYGYNWVYTACPEHVTEGDKTYKENALLHDD
jgi:hypothetical protein